MTDWNPLIIAVAAQVPALVMLLRATGTLGRVEHQTNSRLSQAITEIAALKAHIAALEAHVAAMAPGRAGEP